MRYFYQDKEKTRNNAVLVIITRNIALILPQGIYTKFMMLRNFSLIAVSG